MVNYIEIFQRFSQEVICPSLISSKFDKYDPDLCMEGGEIEYF